MRTITGDNMSQRKLQFFGRVTPERYPLTIDPPIKLGVDYCDFNFSVDLELIIFTSQVTCLVSINKDEKCIDIHTIRNLIRETISSAVDIFGFMNSVTYSVEIISCVDNSNEWTTFGIANLELQQEFGISGSITNAHMYIILGSNALSSVALHDFRLALDNPSLSGLLCYRAIESIMHEHAGERHANDKVKWEAFREALDIPKSDIIEVKTYADYPRHGKVKSISAQERQKILIITRNIINKYIGFLIRKQEI